jgi:SPP1 family predicted phage head-tail adaptor
MLSSLTQRATLLARMLTPDGGGGFGESWDAFAEVWVALAPLGGDDVVTAERLQSRVRHRIALRRRGDVAAGQRLQLGDRLFRIHVVRDAGPRAAYIELDCEELPGEPT